MNANDSDTASVDSAEVADNSDADEELWDELLQFIEDGEVIPIIGRDLVTVEDGGETVELEVWLARRLADALKVPIDEVAGRPTLNAVALRHMAAGGEPERIYNRLFKIGKDLAALPIPEPLRKLASIGSFKLFVTTTFDPFLQRAIDEVVFDGVQHTQVLAYAPTKRVDLPDDLADTDRVVFHLLGKLSPSPHDYVVTEEDGLEFVHSLLSDFRPINLLTEFSQTPLLFIGCSFPGWLMRFLIRGARRDRLLLARGKKDFIVDARGRRNPRLLDFLQNFKTRAEFFRLDRPVEFVDELCRRWEAVAPAAVPIADQAPTATPTMEPGAVFLSYASEDRPEAQAVRDALDAAGIDVWFDREKLFSGDVFEDKIMRNISQCSVFIPLLSRHCLTEERRFFRKEWNYAGSVADMVREDAAFVIPIRVDDIPYDADGLPARFVRLDWEDAPGGRVPAEFVERVRASYEAAERRRANQR